MEANSGKAKAKRGWPWWAEAALVGAVGVLSVQEAYIGAGGTLRTPAAALAAASSLALPLRGRWPWWVAACSVVTAAAFGTVWPLLVVLFHLAQRGRGGVGALCAAAALAGSLVIQPAASLWTTRTYGPLLLPAVVLLLGLWAGSRRRLVVSLDEQVQHLRVERELRAEQARLGERTRIAAEMHDVLAHRLTVLALHTGALQGRAEELPEPVVERVGMLRRTSTEALADLREVLGALRATDAEEVRATGARPEDLPALLDEARGARQRVEAVITGEATAVSTSHRLAIHRVVQEALTNARKHAPGALVEVAVSYGPPKSTVVVRNRPGNSSGSAPVASGFGLIGLTERVNALGGRLEFGPSGAGGWRVTAEIPVGAGPSHADSSHAGAA
ncbi:sensor histidine kinase [Streptomyces sporangiiformans]|uniref:histidine kinase n=1 Tax=Streptomyces sporangiiformans TaxID=2315329 RepID=A0A505DAB3_9ACTN|nr:histidine kinase [Streptomyces sporangiiformans]TPQ21423.1 two-component sensor histidine kinase [Streptomyces sporangiiformans]